MSKLSFRARALDSSKPMPIYMAEELPDLPDYSAINRAVPQMPSGMQKEEECEHHLQRAIVAGLIIPTPEVSEIPNKEFYERVYPANYKQPRQLIHMQPFTMEQDIIDYDMDTEDERWLQLQSNKLDLSAEKFEEMMDRLEKSSGQTVVTLNEAKALLKEDDDLIITVFDYWLNKRLKTQHPLILTVKTEQRAGAAANNPYLAFRRRTEKMQTRKNRKNDEASYEKMLKLRRDLCRAVTLLELVKRREKIKREYVNLTIEVFEKRYLAKDFSGAVMAEASAVKSSRPAFTPIFHNHYTNQSWSSKAILKDEIIPRREKRQYKKRKHKSLVSNGSGMGSSGRSGGLDLGSGGGLSSDEESAASQVAQLSPAGSLEETAGISSHHLLAAAAAAAADDEGRYAFRRNRACHYHMPLPYEGNWPWCSKEEHGLADKRYRYALTSLSTPTPTGRCLGFARRRVGRGGRVILDRAATDYDHLWRTMDFTILEPQRTHQLKQENAKDILSCTSSIGSDGDTRTSSANGVLVKSDEMVKQDKQEYDGAATDEAASADRRNVRTIATLTAREQQEEMLEVLRSIRRECWPHFRPKTPPGDWEPPCDMLPDEEDFFSPLSTSLFSMEVQPMDDPGGHFFVTEPLVVQENDNDGNEDVISTPTTKVPITDTRQRLQVDEKEKSEEVEAEEDDGIGIGATGGKWEATGRAKGNLEGSNRIGKECGDDDEDASVVGCSRFMITGCRRNSSTLTSPKCSGSGRLCRNDMVNDDGGGGGCEGNTAGDGTDKHFRPLDGRGAASYGSNGLLTQFGLNVSPNRTKNNKLYAYPSAVGYRNAAASTLSFHTSAHTLTLNSHSANIFDISIANDSTEGGNRLETDDTSAGSSVSSNNKTIIRKNNFVMEVT